MTARHGPARRRAGADWHVAVDIGGTFTDLALIDRDDGSYRVAKLLTTHDDPARAVLAGFEQLLNEGDVKPSSLETIAHATTLVTNAVIERKGSPTALLVTKGFRDVLLIGREHRYDMYDVRLQKPEPLVSREDTFPVPERVLVDGTVHYPLDESAVIAIAKSLRDRQIDSAAVCLLHSYRYPEHELRCREILKQVAPNLNVSLSHEVVGELREYERASTTVANAYVLRLVDGYLGRLEDGLAGLGYAGQLLVMLSSGAIATTATARSFPVRLIESGPAAGAFAAAEAGRLIDQKDLLSFDMGGTTAKACIVTGGRPTITNAFEVARERRFTKGSGLPLEVSSVELIEIGAGGGSLASLDQMGLLRVGPESAGSEPGPACYGLGGAAPTVTDADLVLGYLDPDYFLGGTMALDVEAARAAINRELAATLGVPVEQAAWYVHEVVNESMANAARIHAVERGADLERLPLYAFGGAGPVHAFRVAQNLGLGLVIVPPAAGVGSTIGLLAAPLAFDFVRTLVAPLDDLDWGMVLPLLSEMQSDGVELLASSGVARDSVRLECAVDMRLAGQAHEITVELGTLPHQRDEERLRSAFDKTYSGLFGRTPPSVAIEVVSWRIRVSGPRPPFPALARAADPDGESTPELKGHRLAYFPELGGFTSTPVFDRYRLGAGWRVSGPAIVEERESTFVIGPGATAWVDEHLNVFAELSQ